ncbi:MAG: hypothetical protein IT371_10645 [Deltaproteobacteria bacterium]|nr:hypothetical protein [Deltaproteobacteria bacterium]
MARSAPLQVTVRLDLLSGPSTGQRCYRLTERVELPPRLLFARDLPIEGEGVAELSFALPDGTPIATRGRLYYDPERPQAGSEAELVALTADQILALQTYVEERQSS